MVDPRRLHARPWLALAVLIVIGLVGIRLNWAKDKDPDALDDNLLKGVDDDLKKGGQQGRFTFEIDDLGGKPIEPLRFVRGIPGQFTVSEFPRGFSIEGHSLFQAGQRLDAALNQSGGVTIFCTAPANADSEAARYASKCSANFPTGTYHIDPFGLTFEVGQNIRSTHPAIAVQGNAVHIRTIPVTFRAVDARTGLPVPFVGFQLICGKGDVLKDLLDTKDQLGFNPLTLYLPVGTTYQSSFGDFSIDETGGIRPSPAAAPYFANGVFSKVIERNAAVATAAPIGPGYWLASQNLRRVYQRGEAAPFVIIASGNLPAARLQVIARGAGGQAMLGELTMPKVAGTDSRLFLLNTAELAPGKYELAVNAADAHTFAIEVVDVLPATPLFLFTVDACGESDFTLDSAGLDQLRDTGVKCWTQYGFGGGLDTKGPGTVPYASAPPDAPPELKRRVTDARALLDDCLRHGLFTIDFEARRMNWYNEGLAYHHSHPMSVDRMVRRVQIFGQELGDYPAFAGLSYTWFPALGGYTEGGVATDPFFQTRMEVLHEKVKQQTGLVPFTQEQSRQWRQLAKIDAAVPQALADQRREFWRAEQRLGYFDSFSLYNQKLREVRKDFIATTSANAGHDEGIHLPDMGGAHSAMTWESYTDYGDWPMSAGFCADWGHGMMPGKPQWQQVEPSQAEPAIVAKQFFKLARGVEGIGVGVHSPAGAASNRQRAKSNRFLERYGSLITGYQPDMTVAVCINESQDRYEYNAHALHSHLTRLGYGPVIVSEQTIEQGVPAGVKVILIPNYRVPFSIGCQKNLKEFMARGGKVVEVGAHCQPIEGAVRVDVPLKNLWDIGGFAAHMEFWGEFDRVRPALEKTMADLGFSPRNGASPEKAVILPMLCGGVRYVAVIGSALTVKDTVFSPVQGVEVKVGAAAAVINLVTGDRLPVKDGIVTIELVNEPVAMLALLDAEPTGITLHFPSELKAGEQIALSSDVKFAGGAATDVPVQYVITDSTGNQRAVFYRLSGAGAARDVRYATSSTEPAGNYSVAVTELLTGLTVKATVKIVAGPHAAAVAETAAVYLPHPDRIPLFLSRKGEVRVVVEETQAQDSADAERIVAALRKSGRAAIVEKVEPGSYDSLKMRWFNTRHEDDVLAKIDAGEVIGYRIDLESYVNKATRSNVPEKGGWADILPKYVLRNDVILFSGGRLAESLRAVSDWLPSPNLPGKGNGVIEVALSPFWADRQAVALISNDQAGRTNAVDRLIELIENGGKMPPASPFAPAAVADASNQTTGSQRSALETPLKGFIPPALAVSVAASADGYSVVRTLHATQLVSPQGKVLRTLPASDLPPAVVAGGTCFGATIKVTQNDPSWNFPIAWKVGVRIAGAQGDSTSLDLPGEVDWIGDHFPGWNSGYAVSPDGKSYFAGQAGAGCILFDLVTKTYRRFNYDPHDFAFAETARQPLFVSSARFSTDGQYVAYTAVTHPSGYDNMGRPPFSPYATEIRLVRVATGEVVWRHQGENLRDGSFAGDGDTLAVSAGGTRTAMIDWGHQAVLFDQAGKELYRKALFNWVERYGKGDVKNKPALRSEMAQDGSTVLYASGDSVLLLDAGGAEQARIDVATMSDARLSPDGTRVYAAADDGMVSCFDRKGARLWSIQSVGDGPKLAAVSNGVLVAEGAGSLLALDASGAQVRRTQLVSATMAAPAEVTWAPLAMTGPALYREPQTVAVLQKYGAKPVGHWEPQGAAHEAFGRKFYPVESKLTFSAPGREMHLVHLVYRHHAAAGKGPAVTLAAGAKSRTFLLDLPTPEYRAVDLPCEEMQDLAVSITPADGLEVAELSVYGISFPGTNAVYVKPANTSLEHLEGISVGEKKDKPDGLDILDDKDSSQAAKAVAGQMKNTGIFARNPDPDQVEGHYLRATGNALDNLDGRKFLDSKSSSWTSSKDGKYGSTLIVDLNHRAHPKLCATYERTLRQSEVMRAIVILRAGKSNLVVGAENPGPDKLMIERCGVGGLLDNDQFFNVFDTAGVEMDALGVFVFSGRGRDHGLSEIELYE